MTETFGPSLTVEQARVRHPAVGRGRLYEAIKLGGLRAVSVGRRLAVSIEDLDGWVADGCPLEQVSQPMVEAPAGEANS